MPSYISRYFFIPTVLLLYVCLASAPYAQEPIYPGLSSDELINALSATYAPVSVLTLAQSKDTLYAVVDRSTIEGIDGVVGLYTEWFVPFDCDPDCDFSQDVYNGGGGITQEHLWPRSLGAGSGLAERDMHHLVPALEPVNAARGNLPFHESPDAETTEWYRFTEVRTTPPTSGRDLWSERLAGAAFEPREAVKGDVARAMVYFFTVYGPSAGGQADVSFFETMKDTLRTWHEADPISAAEVARTERVSRYQSTADGGPQLNPFVLDATLVERAYFPAPPSTNRVIYVDADATGAGDGSSWGDAYVDLQEAFSEAAEVENEVLDVWVAAGTYYPTDGFDRAASFEIPPSVRSVFGGFGGTEQTPDDRDPSGEETVLSGNIGNPVLSGDNSSVVVRRASGTAEPTQFILDALTIADGQGSNASGLVMGMSAVPIELRDLLVVDNVGGGATIMGAPSVRLRGGGFSENDGMGASINGATVFLTSVEVRSNTLGGAVLGAGSALAVANSSFSENGGTGLEVSGGSAAVDLSDVDAVGNATGGAAVTNVSSVAVTGGSFSDNEGPGLVVAGESVDVAAAEVSRNAGGAAFQTQGAETLVLRDMQIEENIGGGVRLTGIRSASVTGSSLQGNSASVGAGLHAQDVDTLRLMSSEFAENIADQAGGALYVVSSNGTRLHVQNATFADNVAGVGGGAIECDFGGDYVSGAIVESTFIRNRTDRWAGAIHQCAVALVNTGMYGNLGGEAGAVGLFDVARDALIVNSVFVGNEARREADNAAGGLVASAGTTAIVNSTFAANRYPEGFNGAGAYLFYGGVGTIYNSVFWENAAPGISLASSPGDLVIAHTVLSSACPTAATCDNTLSSSPDFSSVPSPGDDGEWGTVDDDYGDVALREGSPAIDYGLASYLPQDTYDLDGDGDTAELLPVDIIGQPRLQGQAVDLGAYESPFTTTDGEDKSTAIKAALAPAYPNPFRTTTTMELTIATAQRVVVEAFDVLGRRVAVLLEEDLRPGERYEVTLEGGNLLPGVYFVRAHGSDLSITRRVVHAR